MAAASSSPFGCVLRDRNRCNRDTKTAAAAAAAAAASTANGSSKAAAAFQKNLKVLVRDHLHSCISVSPDENSENQAGKATTASPKRDSTRNNNNSSSSNSNSNNPPRMSSRQVRNLDRWAAKQAEQMVSTIERQSQEAAEELWVVASSNPSSSSCSKKENENAVISSQSSIADSECSSLIGASSLVQIWEARMNQPKLKPLHSRSSSISSLDNLTEEPARHSDVCLDSNNDLLTDWVDSAAHTTASSRHSDVGADGEKSLLKLRFLRRDMGTQSRPVPPPPACRPPQHSASIMQLRERLRLSLEQARSIDREAVVVAPRPENRCRKVDTPRPREKAPPLEQPCPVVVESTVEQQQQQVKQEERSELRAEASVCSPVLGKKEDRNERSVEEVVENNHVDDHSSFFEVENTLAETSVTSDLPHPENDQVHDSVDAWQERYLECAMGDDEAEPEAEGGVGEGEEEEECDEEEQDDYIEEEAPYDWFSDIARPRSYWEDMRRSWYDEMLNNGCGNRDIKELLERKTVSSFLASDFRDRIDRVMLCRASIQATQEQQESDVEENQERMAQLALSYFRRESNDGCEDASQEQYPMVDDDRGGIEETDEETEDASPSSSSSSEYIEQEEHKEESITSRQFVEATDLFEQASQKSSIFSASSQFRPWQSVDEYERFSNAHSQQNHQSFKGSNNQERRCSCCAVHASIDVDVVNELRGNVEELRNEVSELKKLVQSCMEMQMMFAKQMNPPSTSFQ
ncbi:hypothetical protein LINPERHAP1_LOCUS25769 [Linum perenne]